MIAGRGEFEALERVEFRLTAGASPAQPGDELLNNNLERAAPDIVALPRSELPGFAFPLISLPDPINVPKRSLSLHEVAAVQPCKSSAGEGLPRLCREPVIQVEEALLLSRATGDLHLSAHITVATMYFQAFSSVSSPSFGSRLSISSVTTVGYQPGGGNEATAFDSIGLARILRADTREAFHSSVSTVRAGRT